MNWISRPTPLIIAGSDSLLKLPKYVKGNRILICSSKSVVIKKEVRELIKDLGSRNIEIFGKVNSNPTPQEIDLFAAEARDFKPDVLIAIGGGSVIDFTKITGTLICGPTKHKTLDLLLPGYHLNRTNQVIAIPTTCGTGSEVTPFSAVWTSKGPGKVSIENDELRPDICVLNGGLSSSAPINQVLYSGLDALSHCIETLWNRSRDEWSELFAANALEAMLRVFPRLLDGNCGVQDWQKMQESAMFAGLAISQSHTAIAHSISYPLTSHLGIPHGLACSFSIPTIWKSLNEKSRSCLTHAKLISDAVEFIDSLNLVDHVRRYASMSNLVDLIPYMLTSNRANNFIEELDEQDLSDLFQDL